MVNVSTGLNDVKTNSSDLKKTLVVREAVKNTKSKKLDTKKTLQNKLPDVTSLLHISQ